MAYIAKHGDKWRAQIVKQGLRKSAIWDTKRHAQDWANRVESEIAAGLLSAPKTPGMKLSRACDDYLKTATLEKRNALKWERRRFDSLIAHFGDVDLADIDSNSLGKWRDKRLLTVSGSTVLREVNLFRNLFNIAVDEWKVIPINPFKGVRLPKENAARVTVWRWQQIKRILRAGQARGGKTLEVTQAFHIALRTAMRLQEALAAPDGFDSVRRVVAIPPSKENPLPQLVPITRQGYRALLTMPRLKVSPNEASTLFSDLQAQLGIKGLQFRDSRATALTLMARRMDILTLSKISRHKDIRMLQVYFRESAEEISRRL